MRCEIRLIFVVLSRGIEPLLQTSARIASYPLNDESVQNQRIAQI